MSLFIAVCASCAPRRPHTLKLVMDSDSVGQDGCLQRVGHGSIPVRGLWAGSQQASWWTTPAVDFFFCFWRSLPSGEAVQPSRDQAAAPFVTLYKVVGRRGFFGEFVPEKSELYPAAPYWWMDAAMAGYPAYIGIPGGRWWVEAVCSSRGLHVAMELQLSCK